MINLTPHPITVRTAAGVVTFPPSGTIARVTSSETAIGACPVTGAPIIKREWGAVTGLPPKGTVCIVSSLILDRVPGRAGVFAPDTGPTAIRENGQIVAVTRLVAA